MKRKNPFKARLVPGDFQGEAAGHAYIRRGFHVATDMERVIPYAQQKYASQPLNQDYPVIVELDLGGLEYEADVDDLRALFTAFEIIRQLAEAKVLFDHDTEFAPELEYRFPHGATLTPDYSSLHVQYNQVQGLVNDLAQQAEWFEGEWQHAGNEPRPESDILPYLYGQSDTPEHSPRSSLLDYFVGKHTEEIADIVNKTFQFFEVNGFFGRTYGWTQYRFNNVSPDISRLAAAVFGQRRYIEDVPSDRIVSVTYMMPYWPRALISGTPRSDQLNTKLEEAGFQLFDISDYTTDLNLVATEVINIGARRYGVPPLFHGTTVNNLLAAAPEIQPFLPVPPLPYGMSDEQMQDLRNEEIDLYYFESIT